MLGQLSKDYFDPETNYQEFYAGHAFNPLDEKTALNADEVLPRAGWALDVVRELGAKTVADYCCLDGFIGLTIANKTGAVVYGYDLSKPGIALANERAKKFNLLATFYETAVEDIQTNNKVDVVTLMEAIEHFKDPDKVMSVIKAHLKPGGTLLVSTPDAEGYFGIRNTEDTCHLRIYSHRTDITGLEAAKPIVSLPSYLESHGFNIVENEVYNDLIHIRATIA